MLVDEALTLLVQSGSAHIVALGDRNGDPFATRGWGAAFVDAKTSVRVLLAPEELALVASEHELIGRPIAFTATDVRSLVSAQLKGRIQTVEAAGDDDRAMFDAYRKDYYDAVLEVDFISRELMARTEPGSVVACTFSIEEGFDQTPGPRAGREYGTA